MRVLIALTVASLCLTAAVPAGPAEDLAEAKAQITSGRNYGADALLQRVVKSPDAGRAQVEEALYLQTMIYYGDVFGASLVLPSVTTVAQREEPFGGEVVRQIILARRAFSVAASAYLNITAGGSVMQRLQVELPELSNEDVRRIQEVLSNRSAVQALIEEYPSDPAAGAGLLSRANQFGLYIGLAGAMPRTPERDMADVRSKLISGVAFDPLRHLDWLATVSIDMSKVASDPQAPDMLGLARRADERLLALAGNSESQFARNARARLAKYGK